MKRANWWLGLMAVAVAACGLAYGSVAKGNSYAIIPWTQGWISAKADAEARGGHLATITSEEEWDRIWSLFGDEVGGCLLGGTDAGHEGDWSWVTGEPWEYTRWETGEPNNGHNEQHYLWIWAGHDGKWDDVAYSAGSKYLFESENDNNTNITLEANAQTFGAASAGAAVLTGGSGSWTAWTATTWITLNRASGMAGESCIFVVGANPSADTRLGWIFIEDKVFTVTQTGCPASLSPESAEWDYSGGNGEIAVTVDADVSWKAKANVNWLSVTPTSGTGTGSVTYKVSSYTNDSAPRTGTLTIAGQTFHVTQKGKDVTLSPTTKTLSSSAGTFEVEVVAQAGQAWTVTPNVSWISVAISGDQGSRTLVVAVEANPSFLSRTGTVTIGNQAVTVTQAGTTNISFSITPTNSAASPLGASGNVSVSATPDAPWTAEAQVPWITIFEGQTGAGNGDTKYIVEANPSLETRLGQISFKQLPAEPDNQVEAGCLMCITGDTDIATKSRSASRSINSSFDGTFSILLSGDPLPIFQKNDWSFAVRFRVGELNKLNRLMTVFENHALYCDENNKLWFDGRDTGYSVDTNQQQLVFCQDDTGLSRLYAGHLNETLALIAEYKVSPFHDFTQGTTGISNTFVLGYTETPSQGYLKNGSFQNLQLWGRALSEAEVQQVASGKGGYEAVPFSIPSGMSCRHFTCNQNGYYRNNSSWSSLENLSATLSGWSEFPGRHGIRQRAMRSSGSGQIAITDVNQIFPGRYVLNNGYELSAANFETQITKTNTWSGWVTRTNYLGNTYDSYETITERYSLYYPYAVTSTGPFSATYNFWLYLDSLPSSKASVFTRRRWGGKATNAQGRVVNPWYQTNVSFSVNIDKEGLIDVEQNGTSTKLTGGCMPTGRWTMLTMIGHDQNNITIYLDGHEIGTTTTCLSFGYFPPTDCRYYHSDNGTQGSIIETRQWLTVGGWNGAIDEMTFFDGALSSAQVKALYDATKPNELVHTVTQGVVELSVTPTDAFFDASGGNGSINVTVAASLSWTADSSANWISFPVGTNHVGSASVPYTVAPNPGTSPRTAMLTIAGKAVTVAQTGQKALVSYDGTVFGKTNGMGVIRIEVEGNATWTASSDSSWLTLLNTGGQGNAEIMFVVGDLNTSGTSRTATVTIAGQTVRITQRGYTLSIDPVVWEMGSKADVGEISITAPADAVWEATVTEDWITLIGSGMGVGSTTLLYAVAENTTGETRSGKIIISGEEHTVTQHAYLTLTTMVEGSGTVSGGGAYATDAQVTVGATPGEGYEFTHWSGDASGVEPELVVVMDKDKTVTAHFIPAEAAQHLVEVKAAQGGFYTREQMKALALGDTVIEVDPEDGNIDLAIRLQESADLSGGDWSGIDANDGSVGVDSEGRVHIKVAPEDNTAFYRLVNGGAE